jgi:hypothetical protein
MEPEWLLSCSQGLASKPCPQQDESRGFVVSILYMLKIINMTTVLTFEVIMTTLK